MDKTKRKKIIENYLKKSININELSRELVMSIPSQPDQLLEEIGSDLRDREDAMTLKNVILTFNKGQDEMLDSLGSEYIENKKRNLTLEVTRYENLLADPEIRTIVEEWGTTNGIKAFENSVEELKNTSFTHVLKFLENNTEYISEIQEIITEIQNESEHGLNKELQEFSDSLNDRIEEKNKEEAKKEELITFIDETVNTFDTLLQLEDVDENTIESIKNASMESYKIYKDKYSKLTDELANNTSVFEKHFYPTSSGIEERIQLASPLQNKIDKIEGMIEQLEGKYGEFTQLIDNEEKNKEVEENNTKKQQDKKQELWINRLKENDSKVAEMVDGAQKKQEVVQLMHDLEKEDIQRNSDNEQR